VALCRPLPCPPHPNAWVPSTLQGFVPQTQLAKAMTQHKDRYRFHVHVDPAGKFTQGKSVAEDFARHSIDFAEFKVCFFPNPVPPVGNVPQPLPSRRGVFFLIFFFIHECCAGHHAPCNTN
jgi:hypothetical protein